MSNTILIASRAISSTLDGTRPLDAPTPRLSNAITRRRAAIPSMTRGSQSSRTAVKWGRAISGTSVLAPSCRYANVTPSALIVRVGVSGHVLRAVAGIIGAARRL